MQYSFIYQALLEHYLYGDTELDVSSLEKHIQKLRNKAGKFDITGLEEEFSVSHYVGHKIKDGHSVLLQKLLFGMIFLSLLPLPLFSIPSTMSRSPITFSPKPRSKRPE